MSFGVVAESDNFILILIFFYYRALKNGERKAKMRRREKIKCVYLQKKKKKGLNSTLIFCIKGFIMLEHKDKMKLQKIKNR